MYPPPPRMEKLKSQVNVTFWFSGPSDILVVADVHPHPRMKELKSQVNVTFWFSGPSDILVVADVHPPPQNERVEIPGQCDILLLRSK